MTLWHRAVAEKRQTCGLFDQVSLVGAKIRAVLDEMRFLDIHFDPTTSSYSYALIDLRLPYPGDKRLFGWDDYPHGNIEAIRQLESYLHHFQQRTADGSWAFMASPMRSDVENEIDIVIEVVKTHA